MPFHASPASDERSALATFLRQQQDAFRAAAFGLTDDQAGSAATPSTLTVGTLIKHTTGVQRSWLDIVLAAPAPYEDEGSMEDRVAEHVNEFSWQEGDSLVAVLAAYDEVSAEVLQAIATLDLDTAVPVPDAPWNPKDVEAWSVRWVWFHLFEELARHAGHADIIREAVDGATMFELLAGLEDLPATPWLTPWKPKEATAS